MADGTQSVITALSKLILTPILKNGGFTDFMEEVFKSNNILSAVGAGASDYASQYFLDSTMLSNMPIMHPSVNLGQSVLTGGIYTAGDYLLETFDIFKGSKAYKYAWFPLEYNYLSEFIYISLLDSLAQVATPTSFITGYTNMGKVNTKVYVAPVQNGISSQAPVQTTVLKKGSKNAAPPMHKAPSSLKA